MHKYCKDCWNEDCRNASEEFRNKKLDVCIDMIEHPEHWEEDEFYYDDYEW